jgi:hypothetical protein
VTATAFVDSGWEPSYARARQARFASAHTVSETVVRKHYRFVPQPLVNLIGEVKDRIVRVARAINRTAWFQFFKDCLLWMTAFFAAYFIALLVIGLVFMALGLI